MTKRSNIVKILTKEQKQEIYKKYLKKSYKTKKEFAKDFGISTRTLGRVIDEMKSSGESLNLAKGAIVDVYDYSVTKTQITIFKNDENRSVVKCYPKFNIIKRDLIEGNFSDTCLKSAYEVMSLPDFVEKFSEGNITVDHKSGKVFYGTFEIKNTVVDRMIVMLDEKENVKPLAKFLERLMMNPKEGVIEELYAFLRHNDIAISDEGMIIAYRSIRRDWKDFHTGTMDNSIGKIVSMPRSLVDDNPERTCSTGIHAAAWKYASGFGNQDRRLVKVEICPSDVVSVPVDYNGAKMRVCKLKVLSEVEE